MLHLIGLIVVIWLGYILIVGLYECFVDAVAKKIIDSDRLRTMRRDHSFKSPQEEKQWEECIRERGRAYQRHKVFLATGVKI
jgi:hypothetical protein